jgi:predicted nucleic-acid-binding protein
MIAVDTNILVRLVLQDDEDQARTAQRLLVRARRDQTQIFVSDIVLCELVWVLRRQSGLPRNEIADALDRLFRTELIVLGDVAIAEAALSAYRDGTGDFADYLIREHASHADAAEVVTFDRSLKGERGFRVL